ncbi:MAG: ABC transporter permease [Saprospiraceae bacterium]
MFQHQFKIAFRNLRKNASFSFINILGLSLGMACCFLIILYCWHEFNYDTFHKDGDRLYRMEYSMEKGGDKKTGRIPPAIAPALADYFPEMEAVSRFYPRELSIELPDLQQQFELEDVFFVDSSVVDVFQFDFLYGAPKQALHQPSAVVITDVTAMRLFGSTDVVGKALRLAGEDGFQVSGVVKAWPDNAHLAFTMLLPYETMIKVEPAHAREGTLSFIQNNWTATHSYTYVKLKPNQDPEKVTARLATFIQEKGDEGIRDRQSFSLLPLRDIHLYADRGGPKPLGNLNYLYLFLLVGLLTLLIACINFINLSTASSMTRAKEIGVRKVLGAQRTTLIGQFIGESMLLSFLSFILSLGITYLALPYLNHLTGIVIPIEALANPLMLAIFICVFLLTGFLAGLYPAILASRFKAIAVLKGVAAKRQTPWNEWLRRGLITVQFLAAIGFMAGALTVYLQIQYLQHQPMGFNQSLVLSLPLNSGNNLNAVLRPGDPTLRQRMNTFDESLMSNPNIKAVTQCSQLPGLGTVARNISTDSVPLSANLTASILAVDYDFAETFELSLLAGRDFDSAYGIDHISSFLINEKAVSLLAWENPQAAIGQKMEVGGKEGMVVGVLKDFHFQSLHSEIAPLVLEVRPGAFGYFALRIENAKVAETLAFLENKWKAAFPEKVFEYTFLEETLNDTYQGERKLASMIAYAAFLAIFISCFGLFGLAAILTQQRFKEIGIRKVLGASVPQLLQLLAGGFLKLIGVAMLVATPLTWYFLKGWLAEFAYRIEFPWWVTIGSGLVVMLVAFLTISAQSLRAALSNPVDAIRNE